MCQCEKVGPGIMLYVVMNDDFFGSVFHRGVGSVFQPFLIAAIACFPFHTVFGCDVGPIGGYSGWCVVPF